MKVNNWDIWKIASRQVAGKAIPLGKGAKILFLESICVFAILRELHFWDYSEVSNYKDKG